jgi:hypothetical protein
MAFVRALPVTLAAQQPLVDAWNRFGDIVDLAAARLAQVPDAEKFVIEAANGDLIGTVQAADVKRKFSNLTWTLATGGVDNGGVGEVSSQFATPGRLDSWTSAHAAVQVDGLIGYDALHDLGLHYLALHETAHITFLGLNTWYGSWGEFLKTGAALDTYAGSAQWSYNEEVANEIARVVGKRIAFDEIPNPGEGFPMVRNHLGLMIA